MFLGPYRVLDLADHRGQFCGKILADLGAEVVKIEPPGGDPSRMTGPFLDDDQDLEKSVSWFANNTSKKSVVLDIEQADGRSEFLELVKSAKFIIESFHPGHMEKLGLAFKKLSQINPGLIMVSITPFGRTGPYADFKDSDLINMGMGGQMTICGDRDRAPLRFTAQQSYPLAGMYAALAALAAHLEREKTGLGQHIDVSIQESVLQTARGIRIYWEIQNYLEQREGSRMARGVLSFRNIWPCKEGMISWRLFTANLGKWTQALVEWMEEESGAEYLPGVAWEEIDMAGLSQEEINRYEAPFEKFFLEHTMEELFEESLKRRFVLFPLSTTKDLVENEQLNSRDFWEEVSYPELGRTIKHPGIPFRSPGLCSPIRRPPRVGEHSREILEQKDHGRLEVEQPSGRPEAHSNPGPPLAGVKILDFSWVIAGPKATKFLANLGATVVRVESEQRLDFLRAYPPFPDGIPGLDRSGTFAHLNDGKYGFTLNLKHPQAGTVLKRLVKWADVVLENFTPGTMERFGLSYDDLKRINPEIIMFRASLMGQTGPYAGQTGLGTMLQAYAGFSRLIGWPDRAPVGTAAAYTDYPAAGFIDIGILAAIDYKRRTGRGLVVDLSQLEAAQQMLIPALLDYTANGRVLEADGNRDPDACPHGAYPCLGDDRWSLIAVFDDREWEGVKAAMGNPDWAESGKFSTIKSRKANEDELDRQISAWTIKHAPEEIMALLQKAGVPAGMVKNGRDIHEDIQLKHRDYLVPITHQEMGKMFYDRPPFRFSRTPFEMKLPSPCLGEHTELVCREFLGMNDEEFIRLLADGVFV